MAMIEQTLDSVIRNQPKIRIGRKAIPLSKAAIGSALAVAVTMSMLKYDIVKNYFDLSGRIEAAQHAPAARYDAVQEELDSLRARIDGVAENGFVIADPCYERLDENLYEVNPCSMNGTDR